MGNTFQNRQQQAFNNNRKKRWSNEDQDPAERRAQQRKPYDPSLEKIVGEVGRVSLDKYNNAQLIVEFTTYDNGPRRVELRRVGTDREGSSYDTKKPGRLWAEQCRSLASLLTKAADELAKDENTRAPARR